MSNATKRSILRWVHLILTIPILGYIYQPAKDVEQYAGGVRYIFVPVMILSGYWMYAGAVFAVIGVAVWLGAYRLSGFGAALLSQIALFIARKIWLVTRARNQNHPA
jgi:thiosulfate reductase cytochrome b subunit